MTTALVLIGPPGSGKSTFCSALSQVFLKLNRPFCIINLDPANESLPYDPDIDIEELINLDDVMDSTSLGPNGGLLYCMDFIYKNIKWLENRLTQYTGSTLLIDCPGQIELYTHSDLLKKIIKHIEENCDVKAAVLNLMDSSLMTSPSTFISACLISLSMMTHLEMPHINALSKIDLLGSFYESLRFGLEFYTDISQISRLLNQDDFKYNNKLARLSSKICEIIEDFGLISFQLLSVSDNETMLSLLRQIDRALGNGDYYIEDQHDMLVTDRIGKIEEKYANN